MDTLWPSADEIPDLYDSQREALRSILTHRVGILTGTPGTGKSYVTAKLIATIVHKYGAHQVASAAPTGKAAVRVNEFLEENGIFLQSRTIHRLLEIGRNGHDGKGWGFQRNRNRPLSEKFIFIDEVSMLDCQLAASLFCAIEDGAHVLMVGDQYQLPPVGHGAPLRDFIASGRLGFSELTEIHRNAGDIVRGCRAIKEGRRFDPYCGPIDLATGRNWKHIEVRDADDQIRMLEGVLRHLPAEFDPLRDVQIVCALNGKKTDGDISRHFLNSRLQLLLNPNADPEGKARFCTDDKVICNKNTGLTLVEPFNDNGVMHYEEQDVRLFVANGESGIVRYADEKTAIIQLFLSGKHVSVSMKGSSGNEAEANVFDLGYAVTCHKMQGSQAPVVVLMLDSSNGANQVCSREWHYTAVSRAEQICLTIGQWSVMQSQCKKVSLSDRNTFLVHRLQGAA